MDKIIPVLRPDYDEQTIADLGDVLRSGWTGQASKTKEFEEKFAELVGAKHCIATNSGTSALDLCLKAYSIRGGELITTPMTFVADAIVGLWNDMDVTFADIDHNTLCIDPKTIKLTDKTKAIIAVDSHGRLADIDGIRQEIERYNPKDPFWQVPLIIEDAAHACYTPGAGKKGDIAIWSFQAVKSMPIFDGGAITTNDDAIAAKLRKLTWLGIEKSTYDRAMGKRYSWDYDLPTTEGIKAYMTDVQAVIGLGQLRRLPELLGKRRAIQSAYNEAFRNTPQIRLPEYSATVQYYTPEVERRDELSDFLAGHGITTSVHFKPLTEMIAYKQFQKYELPVCEVTWPKLLSLPVYHGLTWEDCEFIIEKVKEFYK